MEMRYFATARRLTFMPEAASARQMASSDNGASGSSA